MFKYLDPQLTSNSLMARIICFYLLVHFITWFLKWQEFNICGMNDLALTKESQTPPIYNRKN